MKILPFLPTLTFVLLCAVFSGCTASEPAAEKRLEFISQSDINNQTTVYKYKFNFENNAWMDITAYVKKEKSNFIISINEPAENNLITSLYSPDLDEQNLKTTNRVRPETVESLEEAIVKSIMFYLADNI